MPSLTDRALAYRIFSQALDLEPQARADFLDQHCGSDGALRAEVQAYLDCALNQESSTRALLGPTPGPEASLEGTTVGRFRLIARIGAGGMGVVYRAERIDGVQQSVAVKLISSTLDPSAKQRFAREAQLLARLEHPAVARLIDADVADGRAWIAIEFVRGEPIDEYCSKRSLPAREIVKLLVQLADAVAAAHAMLVVHSDIKPANVLVTCDRTPKLIDLGISTTLRDATSHEAATQSVGRLFSPSYAAPEQLTDDPVTVATDVFGLGALAYRLLTGQPPHADAVGAIAYVVAVTHRDVGLASRAAAEAGRSQAQIRALRGDLDAILGKALEREPARRYRSAIDLRTDLQRHLEQRPIAARPASPVYRAAKFVRRNALAASLSALLLASLAGGGLFAGIQAHRAATARDESRTVTAFLTNDILAAANPMIAGTRDVQLRPLLDQASQKLTQRFAGQPMVLAELQAAMGAGYAALFDTGKAEALLTAAEAGLAHERGNSDAQTENVRLALWYLYVGNIDLPKVYALSTRIAEAERSAGRDDSAMAYRARLALQWIPCLKVAPSIGLSSCADVVRPIYRDAREHFGPDALATHEMAWFLGVALMYSARDDEAEPILRGACAGLERFYGPVHHRLTACRRYLAKALDNNGEAGEAVTLLERAVRNFETTLGPDSQFTSISNFELATALLHAGRPAEAVEAARSAVQAMQRPGAADRTDLWRAQATLSDALVKSGRVHEGLALAEQCLAAAAAAAGAGSAALLPVRERAADAYLDAGEPATAVALLRENLAQGGQLSHRPAWLAGQLEAALGYALMAEQRRSEAMPLVKDAVQILSKELGPANHRTILATAAWQALQ